MKNLILILLTSFVFQTALACNSLLQTVLNPNYDEYVGQIASEHAGTFRYYANSIDHWQVNEGLKNKIKYDGFFVPYSGNTIVFELSEKQKNEIAKIQELVRSEIPALATPLSKENLHLTLHDLFSARSHNDIFVDVVGSYHKVKSIFKELQNYLEKHPEHRFIDLQANIVAPSVNTSMVIAYRPKTKKDFDILFNLHRKFDGIVTLPYLFRPHVTLDYFLPRGFSEHEISQLKEGIKRVNAEALSNLKLDLMKLSYQLFTNMDEYKTVFRLDGDL